MENYDYLQVVTEANKRIGSYPLIKAVETEADFSQAEKAMRDLKAEIGTLEDRKKEFTKPLNDHLKKVREVFQVPIDKLTEYYNHVKRLSGAYIEAKQRAAAEEQARLDRIAAEQKAKLEAAAAAERKKADELLKAGNIGGAVEAQEKAAVKSVMADMTQASTVAEVKKAGMYSVDVYEAEVVDIFVFLKYCYELKRKEFVEVRLKELERYAKANEETEIPGIKITIRKDYRKR